MNDISLLIKYLVLRSCDPEGEAVTFFSIFKPNNYEN